MNGTVVIAEGAVRPGVLGTFYKVHEYTGPRAKGMTYRLDVEYTADRRSVSAHYGSLADVVWALHATMSAARYVHKEG